MVWTEARKAAEIQALSLLAWPRAVCYLVPRFAGGCASGPFLAGIQCLAAIGLGPAGVNEGDATVASDTSGIAGIAGRYAAALYDLADERKDLDAVAEGLVPLKTMIEESEDLRRLIRSPLIDRRSQKAAIDAVLEKAETPELVRRFVAVVADNRRLFALPAMIDAYRRLLAERRGEVTAEVTSAAPLSDGQVSALTEVLRQKMGAKVAVDLKVDQSIIGGLIVKVGSRMIDNSLRTKLQRLQFAMKGVS